MTTTVQLSGLGKRYRAATALDDVSLELASGRVHLLVGPDGAGMTTLLRVLADLARPTRGLGGNPRPAVFRPAAPGAGRRGVPGPALSYRPGCRRTRLPAIWRC